MNPNKTEIIALVDRSGSMADKVSAMTKGWDTFIQEQRKVPGECLVTLARFDEFYELVYVAQDIQKEPSFNLEPRGWTALYDSLVTTIDAQGARLALLEEKDRPAKVIFLVFTDGLENASTKWKSEDVRQRVKHQEEVYKWQFVYVGAHVDAFTAAGDIGLLNVYRNTGRAQSIGSTFSLVSQETTAYRTGGVAGMSVQKDIDDEGNEK